ncbi:MAG: hypothetical protein KME43_13720 [Myxacorys chilensis ATA2-1-KO14]|jgi:transcriptional regulator with XRE-family HTH domain|nr:hypothetical protein [Myxacorys chilensis ATA2-1-KO14]
MNQILHAQFTPIASVDGSLQQQSHDQIESHLALAKRSRNRGAVLSHQGWQKLMQAGVLGDEFGKRYTYEQLSERSTLDERTVSRLLSCEVKVDKSTLKTFFRAFSLLLEASDYTLFNSDRTGAITPETTIDTASTKQSIEVDQLVEELSQLKQRMREYDRLFHRLGLNEGHIRQQLRA